jgi:hypothetical protein
MLAPSGMFFSMLLLMFLFGVSAKSGEVHNTSPVIANIRKGGVDYPFLTGSINMPSISKSIFRRLAASLAAMISLKGPAITR